MDDSSHPSDKQLRYWYENTSYRVFDPPLDLRVGHPHPKLDQFLNRKNLSCWAYITAWNPDSRLSSRQVNEKTQKKLYRELREMGLTPLSGEGMGLIGDWPPEPSFLVPGLSLREAVRLGRKYGQKAILFGISGGRTRLVFL